MSEVRSIDDILDDLDKSLEKMQAASKRMDNTLDGFNNYGAIWLIAWLGCCAVLIALLSS